MIKRIKSEDGQTKYVKEKEGAIDELNRSLANFGIEIVYLSAPAITIHPEYEDVLNKKRLAEEARDEYVSYQLKAMEEKQTKINTARGQADSLIERARGQARKVTLEADAEFEAKTFESKALRVKAIQQAEGVSAQTKELAGPGGDTQVGLAIAEALQDKKIIIVPSQGAFNVLDINELIQSYGATKALQLNPAGPAVNPDAPANPQPKTEPTTGQGQEQ